MPDNSTASGGGGMGSGGTQPDAGSGVDDAPEAAAPDPCAGMTCITPPPGKCEDAMSFKAYDTTGSCVAGSCNYTSRVVPCTCEADACTTDPCEGVTCNAPPTTACKDAKTMRTYAAMGTCHAGGCSYAPTDTPCSFGCANGGCKPDPCLGITCGTPPANQCESGTQFRAYNTTGSCSDGNCTYSSQMVSCTCVGNACTTDPCAAVTCNMPPSPVCADVNTRRGYAPTGTCSGGSCTYAQSDTPCPFGCSSGACKADPCLAVTCNTPPAATCTTATAKRTYASTGTCSGGTCSYVSMDAACVNQACVNGGCTGVCSPNAVRCNGEQPQKCDANGAWQNNGAGCSWPTPACGGGVCNAPRSCVGLAATCGLGGNVSCCAANVVTGGTYNRANQLAHPATVSDFRLDNYEITVGRFRRFVAAYSQTMTAAGAGKNPNNGSDPGWDIAWNASLPASAAELTTLVKCDATRQTWTDIAGSGESRPMNCIDWYEAYAFCIWDGGRLPTEAEWNYAAAGGSEQRQYPWGAAAPDCSYANFYNYAPDYCVLPGTGSTSNVGSESPKGDGKWGQSDLAGNVWEWTEDWYATPYTDPCNNCSNAATATYRVIRGASFNGVASDMLSSFRYYLTPSYHFNNTGARCARRAP